MPHSCYIHIPFCAKICTYCDFYRLVHEPEWEERYIKAITKEIELRMSAEPELPVELATLYFGGGTPTILSENSWQQIFETLNRFFTFAGDAEITSEANPESSTKSKLQFLKSLGVNRLSFGAQSFDSKNLVRLGRLHDSKQIGTAVANARSAGFDNFSLDLMYGLPDETDATLQDDLSRTISLEPKHISFYALTLEGNVPLRYQVERGEIILPDDETITRRYTESVEEFANCGYQQYEISNFAIKGFESHHNRQYWLLEDYLAFGPAAVGTVRGARYKNEPDLYLYVKHLASGKLPPQDIEVVNSSKRMLETIMLSLRLTSGLDTQQLKKQHRYDLLKQRGALISDLCSSGDLIQENDQIRLTPRGMFRSDMIAAALCPDFV